LLVQATLGLLRKDSAFQARSVASHHRRPFLRRVHRLRVLALPRGPTFLVSLRVSLVRVRSAHRLRHRPPGRTKGPPLSRARPSVRFLARGRTRRGLRISFRLVLMIRAPPLVHSLPRPIGGLVSRKPAGLRPRLWSRTRLPRLRRALSRRPTLRAVLRNRVPSASNSERTRLWTLRQLV
jgi:hypothetical protein